MKFIAVISVNNIVVTPIGCFREIRHVFDWLLASHKKLKHDVMSREY